jgi:hypothetical protein
MPNLTSVTVTAGVPTAGTGTVSTLDGVFQTANGPVAIKAASTAPVATDPALVVALSPNSVNANGQKTSANSAPVVLASDQSAISVNNTPTPTTAAGVSSSSTIITTSNGVLSVKASAGSIKKIELSNIDTVGYWFKLCNITTTPIAGTSTVFRRLYLPPGAIVLISYEYGLDFSTGIGYFVSSGIADNDTGAVTASKVVVSIDYK